MSSFPSSLGRWALAACAFALSLCALSRPALAYRTAADLPKYADAGAVRWAVSSLNVQLTGDIPNELSASAASQALDAALLTWSSVACAELTLSVSDSAPDISIRWVSDWSARGLDARAPATTEVSYRSSTTGWVIENAAVLLNAEHHVWTTSAGPPDSRDLAAVLTHELGHALGLLHVCEEGGQADAPRCSDDTAYSQAAMYPTYRGTQQRNLSADDEAGICFLYGADRTSVGAADAGADAATILPEPVSQLGDPCTDAAECGGQVCGAGGYCTTSCGLGEGCAAGFSCGSDGVAAECSSELAMFGASCAAPEECMTGLCLVEGASGRCTRACTDDCPSGYACESAGGRSICLPNVSSGCSLATPAVRAVFWPWPVLLFALFMRRGRKKRCRVS